MASQASLRRIVLMEIYRRSGGDTERAIPLVEVAEALKLPINGAVVIVGQLVGKDWVRFRTRTLDPQFTNWSSIISMRGIEEAEKIERGALRRFYEDHFALAGSIWTIVVLVLSVVLNVLAQICLKKWGLQ
jgi:hypothetical protein